MQLKKFLYLVADLGSNPFTDSGKSRLYRAANLFVLNALFWMLYSFLWDLFDNAEDDSIGIYVLPWIMAFQLFVLWLNRKGNTFLALTLLNFSSSSMLVFFAVRAGEEAGIHFHFISLIIGTCVMFAYKEARNYFILNLAFALVAFILLIYGFKNIPPEYIQSPEELIITRRVHFSIVTFVTVFFSFIVLVIFNRQEKELRKALEEKETLLSEVFHRVKNNMAVILGLINLKKNQSHSEEAVEALLQCHMRVMSMAMVHNRIYENKSLNNIQLDLYLSELSEEVLNSLNAENLIELKKDLHPTKSDISKAIPIGLIVNEVITNAFKHGFKSHSGKLEIHLHSNSETNGKALLIIKDNGPGIAIEKTANTDSLGMSLIYSLSEQIDGECTFSNEDGLIFRLTFPN